MRVYCGMCSENVKKEKLFELFEIEKRFLWKRLSYVRLEVKETSQNKFLHSFSVVRMLRNE